MAACHHHSFCTPCHHHLVFTCRRYRKAPAMEKDAVAPPDTMDPGHEPPGQENQTKDTGPVSVT
eukprot:13200562-Alexandrium_andersonii.AAC.1